MTICILQDYLRNGGTERQSILLARRFIAEGHNVTLVRFRPGGALAATINNVPSIVLQPFDCIYSGFAPGLVSRLRELDPEAILCMGREANRRGALLQSTFPRAAVVATLRTGKVLSAGFQRSLHAVSHVVANSEASAGLLRIEHGVSARRVSVIKNALVFPPSAAAGRNEALRQQQGAGADTVVLLCVGMFRPEKNQRALLEIAAQLPTGRDWQLWFGGTGPAEANCRELCRQLGLDGRVRFLGFQADPAPLYRAADIAVLGSRSESLSNFLIEAQAHGLPAVAYAATGVDECLADGESGRVVAMDDVDGFLTALQPLISDADMRARWGECARDFARSAFDPAARARDYLELFAKAKN